jgi:beta-N-acetylhexosaminidase
MRSLFLLGAVLVLAVACTTRSTELPSEPASIAGRITAVDLATGRTGVVRVEANPQDSAGSDKAIVRVTGSTKVRAPASTNVEPDGLRVGQWVRVWFIGPVRESYPVQADAGTIVIDSLGSSP